MYVSKKDINVVSDLIGLLDNAIEGGAEPYDEWLEISRNANSLYEKMRKDYYKQKSKRTVKKVLERLSK